MNEEIDRREIVSRGKDRKINDLEKEFCDKLRDRDTEWKAKLSDSERFLDNLKR